MRKHADEVSDPIKIPGLIILGILCRQATKGSIMPCVHVLSQKFLAMRNYESNNYGSNA